MGARLNDEGASRSFSSGDARRISSHLHRRWLWAMRRQVFLTATSFTFRRDWHWLARRSGSVEQPTRPGDFKEDP
jgi:hypothetical protein